MADARSLTTEAPAIESTATPPIKTVSLHLQGDAQSVLQKAFAAFHLRVELSASPALPALHLDIDDATLATLEQVLAWQTHLHYFAT